MNDKPTSTEMVFGGFLLVFGIIAGIGIEKQMHLSKCVRYEWKTNSVILVTNTVGFHMKLETNEPTPLP